MPNLLDKLAKLKAYFLGNRADGQDVNTIDGWIDQARRLFLLNSLKDHDGIKYVLEIFQSEVERIDNKLRSADSKELPDYQRDRLLDRKELAKKYLDMFQGVSEELEAIEEQVDIALQE